MSQIDPVPDLSNHLKDRLTSERADTVLLLKLLGFIFQAQKGRRTYTNLTKKVVTLLSESDWRKLPHAQLVQTAR